jgi:hypothetical protein
MQASDHFEYATAGDPARNYCLWQYAPVAPAEDKFRAVNLLFHAFEVAGLGPRAFDFVEAIRDAIGMFRTVFGVKLVEGRLGFEFYFYDYARREREVSISRVVEAIRPFAGCPVPINEQLPYFMFSIDVDEALVTGRRELDVIHMYVGNPGSLVSSGIAYALRAGSTRLENFYFFFDASTQLSEAVEKICCSAYFDATRMPVERVLWPELRRCRTFCVANKQANDTIYCAGVDVSQLLFFLRRLDYPGEIVGLVEENRGQLDHLLYDVGIDYRVEGADVRILKSGYYGVF